MKEKKRLVSDSSLPPGPLLLKSKDLISSLLVMQASHITYYFLLSLHSCLLTHSFPYHHFVAHAHLLPFTEP